MVDASKPGAEPEVDFFEDYGRDEGPGSFLPAHWLFRVGDGDGNVLWGWAPLPSSGCVSDLPDADEYAVAFFDWAYFETTDHSIVGLDCNAMPDCDFQMQPLPAVVPSGGTTTTVFFNPQVALPNAPKQQYPMWAATFAAASYEPWPNETVYLGVDSADFAASTSSSYAFGGQPSILFKGQGWTSKFAAAHEYGHLQSLFVPITALSSEDIDCSLGGSGHTLQSVEMQPCAAVEGFADFFSAVTWNDPTEIGSLVYVQVESDGSASAGSVGGNTTCPDFGPGCEAGTANELDWAGALRQLQLDVASVSVERALHMLWHVWMWPGSADSPLPYTDFWPAFDDAMDPAAGGYLTAAEYSAWVAIADAWEIDQ